MKGPEQTDTLGTLGIGRLIARLALPASVALIVSSTYNLVDTIFVGRGVGPTAIGALTLTFPFQIFVMAFGNLVGIGAASIISRALGAGDQKQARVAAGTAMTLAIAVGLSIATIGSLFPHWIVAVLGGSEDLREPTLEYMRVILLAEPLIVFNLSVNNLIRAEGRARVAMVTMVSGLLLNIGLDPLFIFGFGWGVRGAAIATLIGHALTTMLIVMFYARGNGTVRPTRKDLRPNLAIALETIKVGSSGFVRQLSTSMVQGLRNNLLVIYGGTMFVSAFGIVFRSLLFLAMPAMGIAQALPPIAGYNYGAGKFDRVRKSVWVSMAASSVVMWVGLAIMEVFPEALFRLFSSDPVLILEGVPIMRVNAIALFVFPAYFIGPAFYQAVGQPGRALILAMTRPIFAAAVMLVGVRLVGPLGVVAADPIGIAAGAVLSLLLLRSSFRRSTDLGASHSV